MNSLSSYLNSFTSGIAVIARPKLNGLGEHWGVLLPNGMVAHTTDGKGPHYVTYQEFSAGKQVKEIRKVPMSEKQATLSRVHQEISQPSDYDLLANNCEIFANRITGGAPESQQVKWGFLLALAGFSVFLAKAG